MKRILLTVMTALLLNAEAACAGPFDDGVAAYGRGDYATAAAKFRPLAVQENASAQSNLGGMYDQGKGGPRKIMFALTCSPILPLRPGMPVR